MLNKTLSYRSLLRVIALLFICYGLYLIVCALTAQINVSGSVNYQGPILFEDPGVVWLYIFFGSFFPANPIFPIPYGLSPFVPAVFQPGPLFPIGIGILMLGLASQRTRIAYISLLVAFWCVSMSFWLPLAIRLSPGGIDTMTFSFPYLFVSLVFFAVLLACYKPIMRLLRNVVEPEFMLPPAHA
jgi:hypothetical protein